MADQANFRLSGNIEDRRRAPFVPTPGPFGDGVNLPNVFDNGLLTGLDPARDFVQTGPTPLGNALGLSNLESAMTPQQIAQILLARQQQQPAPNMLMGPPPQQ